MEEKTYLTVTALNKYIERKFKLDPYLGEVYIKGEISNFKPHGNNIYFSIKDENSVIRANWFGARSKDFKDGDTVLIKTKVDFYLKRGEVNLVVLDMKKDRIGELYQKFLELKEKLEKEGLFSPQYKKRIPSFSQNIAVVTAKTGAAVQDITRTIQRRFPIAKINIYSTLVQGENSVQDIVKNIKLADDGNNDVIILGRGGGSIEDLWSFNTEEVIRAIFNCKTPIVTGIGHETDTTLADFVSDRRASTPTAAAELVTPNIEDIKNRISFNYDKLTNKLINKSIFIDLKQFYPNIEQPEPDGLIMTNNGEIYTCVFSTGTILHVDNQGKEIERIKIAAKRPTCVTIGSGIKNNEMFVTTGHLKLDDEKATIDATNLDGDLGGFLFKLKVDKDLNGQKKNIWGGKV